MQATCHVGLPWNKIAYLVFLGLVPDGIFTTDVTLAPTCRNEDATTKRSADMNTLLSTDPPSGFCIISDLIRSTGESDPCGRSRHLSVKTGSGTRDRRTSVTETILN